MSGRLRGAGRLIDRNLLRDRQMQEGIAFAAFDGIIGRLGHFHVAQCVTVFRMRHDPVARDCVIVRRSNALFGQWCLIRIFAQIGNDAIPA